MADNLHGNNIVGFKAMGPDSPVKEEVGSHLKPSFNLNHLTQLRPGFMCGLLTPSLLMGGSEFVGLFWEPLGTDIIGIIIIIISAVIIIFRLELRDDTLFSHPIQSCRASTHAAVLHQVSVG